MTEFFRQANYWKMAIFKVCILMFTTAGGVFMTQTETLSDASWASLGMFLKSRIFLGMAIASATVLYAFLDQTMAALRGTAPPVKHPDA